MCKIALGGGCHWCTEAVFQSLMGVLKVEQGFVASIGDNSTFSEAVIVHFNAEAISHRILIEIHLHTHRSTSNHSMRSKYRSAIYAFSETQKQEAKDILESFQNQFENKIVTQALIFSTFKASRRQIQDYYYKNPKKPFCKNFINPKLSLLLKQFAYHADKNKLRHLQNEVVVEKK